MTNIVRFIYATEIIDYEFYPQNPLERSKLDQFFEWHSRRRTQDGLLMRSDLQVVEEYFIGWTQPFLCGFHALTIADIVAFFAIMPAHRDWLMEQKQRDSHPKLVRWTERLFENEDLVDYLDKLKLGNKAIGLAQTATQGQVRPKL